MVASAHGSWRQSEQLQSLAQRVHGGDVILELERCGGGEGSRDGIESVPPEVRRGNQAHAILQECMAWPRHGRECGALACICVGMCTCLRTRGCVRVVPACALWQSLCASNICGLPGV